MKTAIPHVIACIWLVCLLNCAGPKTPDADQVTEITVAQAHLLVTKSNSGDLKLNRLTNVSPEVAAVLAKNKHTLQLDALTELSPQVAAELAKHAGSGLLLNGLVSLSPEASAELAKYKGQALHLYGLRGLSTEAAIPLANYQGQLCVEGEQAFSSLKTLTPELAKMLAKQPTSLALIGLTSLSLEAATELAKHRGNLMLPSMLTSTPGVAEAMAMHQQGSVEWIGVAGEQPDGQAAISLTLARAGSADFTERRDSDSATLRYNQVPRLFFREADSPSFNKAGPKLDGVGAPLLCWSFSPDGRLLAVGSGERDRQRLEGMWVNVSSGYIHVFEVPSGKSLMATHAANGSKLGAISKIGFSEDGKTVLYEADAYGSPIY